jgi:hypothetical protein
MKRKIQEHIYTKSFEYYYNIRVSDLPKDIQDSDIIEIHKIESYHSENESYDAFTELVIFREREETDKEYSDRISKNKELELDLKNRRYQTYLKLKEEFESKVNE